MQIPYFTLLDLDREKEGAGWGRIQYVRDQLVKLHGTDSQLLKFTDNSDNEHSIADPEYDNLAETDITEIEDMEKWMSFFVGFRVHFSKPLDLDFSMLGSFTDEYKALAPRGPRLPKPGTPAYEDAIQARVELVLSPKNTTDASVIGQTYSKEQKELFAWYKHLFIDGSKPVSHMRALLSISQADLSAKAPQELKDMVNQIKAIISPSQEDENGTDSSQ